MKNRQIQDEQRNQIMEPRLFGLYPEKFYFKQPSDTSNKMQHMIPQFQSTDTSLNTQSSTQQMTDFQKNEENKVCNRSISQ